MRRWSWTGLGAALLCALAVAPASAAFKRAPIELGPGDGNSPSVVVDGAGTAHIVWGIAEELIGYCALPRGTRACVRTARIAFDARAGRPVLLQRPQDGALIVVSGREDESVWAFASADGATWSGPAPIGLGLSEIDAAVLTADGQAVDLLQAVTGAGNLFQRAPLAGSPAVAVLNLSDGFDFPGDMVRLADGRTLAFLGSAADGFGYRLLGAGDPLADASWRPERRVTREWEEPRAAAGPRGVYVMYGNDILDQVRGEAPQFVRRLRKGHFRRPRGLFYEVAGVTSDAALAQDGKGRLYAAMVGYANPGNATCIAFARTSKRRWFTRAVSVHRARRRAQAPGRVRLAVAPSGGGVIAWATRGTPSVARVQRLRAGMRVTRPQAHSRRGCPPFPR